MVGFVMGLIGHISLHEMISLGSYSITRIQIYVHGKHPYKKIKVVMSYVIGAIQ